MSKDSPAQRPGIVAQACLSCVRQENLYLVKDKHGASALRCRMLDQAGVTCQSASLRKSTHVPGQCSLYQSALPKRQPWPTATVELHYSRRRGCICSILCEVMKLCSTTRAVLLSSRVCNRVSRQAVRAQCWRLHRKAFASKAVSNAFAGDSRQAQPPSAMIAF